MLLDETGLEHLNAFETLATKTARENQNYNSKKNIRMTLYIVFNIQRVHVMKNQMEKHKDYLKAS